MYCYDAKTRQKIADDIKKSAHDFEHLVWPKVSPRMGGGSLLQMEGHASDTLKTTLDQQAGLDALQLYSRGVRALATRVQWSESSYDSFTVRLSRETGQSTEFEKRWEAIQRGDVLTPALTVQGYVSMDRTQCISAGIIETKPLYEFIKQGRQYHDWTIRETYDGTRFYAVDWDALREKGIKIVTV